MLWAKQLPEIPYKVILTIAFSSVHAAVLQFNMFSLFIEIKSKVYKTCVPSMIHTARPTVPPVVIIILTWMLFCFARFWKVDRQHVRK